MKTRDVAGRIALMVLGVVAGANRNLARAHGSLPIDTPIERLVKNLDARLAQSPDDPQLHYMLGRLHALAFETRIESADARGSPPTGVDADLGVDWSLPETDYWILKSSRPREGNTVSTPEQQRAHLPQALLHLNRAIELAPAVASYHLALASILESGEPMAAEVEVSPLCPVQAIEPADPKRWIEVSLPKLGSDDALVKRMEAAVRIPGFGLPRPSERDAIVTLLDRERKSPDEKRRAAARQVLLADWKEQITEQFFIAFTLALPVDGARSRQPTTGLGSREMWIAYEAGAAYVRIVTARGARTDQTVRLAAVSATLKAFDDLPFPHGITAIVFSLDRGRLLAGLLDPSRSTAFDLDGSGLPQRWPWVARDTAILVWDPLQTGRITSGRQLFGSVSWWLFFENGYDALDALDDDRDGELTGDELRGLSVWTDRNGDGRSDPGEVVPIEELGVVTISCRATGASGESPCNPRGVTLASGAVLPTYDWVAHPLPAPSR